MRIKKNNVTNRVLEFPQSTKFEKTMLLKKNVYNIVSIMMKNLELTPNLDSGPAIIEIRPTILCVKLLKNKSFAYIMCQGGRHVYPKRKSA